jgi:hypothetical protein
MLKKISNVYKNFSSFLSWKKRGYLGNYPQFVKNKIFLKYFIGSGVVVETGTLIGTSTDFFSNNFPIVHSIEPAEKFFNISKKKFLNRKNVFLYNLSSEDILDQILNDLKGDINFWLDGHYSGGETYKGKFECPIISELNIIENRLNNFQNIVILIDDVRLFGGIHDSAKDYPQIRVIIDWALKNEFKWFIEADILVLSKLV